MIDQRRRGQKQFLLMATFFIGPLILAVLIYYGGIWRPAGSTEHGELLSPLVRLPDAPLVVDVEVPDDDEVQRLRRKWSLINHVTGDCDDACQAALYTTRQIRKALSKERDRTQRVLLISGDFDRDTMELQHPDLIIVTDEAPIAAELATALGENSTEFIYLADPLGNLMMRFPRDISMKEIHTDLKKLLKLSRIG